MKIKRKKLIKIIKAVNRIIDIELGVKLPRSGFHLTSKKDVARRLKNNVRWRDIDVDG
jgi:hypothetical protein